MQIAPLAANPTNVRKNAPAAAVPGEARAVARTQEAGAAAVAAPVRGGLRVLDTGLNARVAGAQQALDFLDQAGEQLQGLKAALSGRLSGSAASGREVQARVDRFASLWGERRTASGGSLDPQLRVVAPGAARQGFTIRGFDLDTLLGGERETIAFSVRGRQSAPLLIEPGLSERELLRRVDHALLPTGVRAERGAQGRLRFSASETDWPALRESIGVKGGGQRFPTGRFNTVRAEAEAEAVRPQGWQTDDTAALRRTLQEVVTALDLVRRARAAVTQVLAKAEQRFEDAPAAEDAQWAAAFVAKFEQMGDWPDFQVFAAISPALIAVSRQRVLALLNKA